jgi:uncharacterized membrane protein (DUF4010 family)
MVTITVDGKTIEINNGTANYISTAMYSGEMSISVTPVTEGYNTPAATTATHTGVLEDKLNAKRIPVTAALKSNVAGKRLNFCHAYSVAMQVATQASVR